jgi:hypothetical protein
LPIEDAVANMRVIDAIFRSAHREGWKYRSWVAYSQASKVSNCMV